MRPILDAYRRLTRTPLFRREPAELTSWQILFWWEARRLPFNLIVGAAGVVTFAVMLACAIVCERVIGIPIGMPDPPILVPFAIAVYAFAANVCYTGGWIAELIALEVWGERARPLGEIAFGLGVMFSALLTLLPAALVLFAVTLRVVLHLLGIPPLGWPEH